MENIFTCHILFVLTLVQKLWVNMFYSMFLGSSLLCITHNCLKHFNMQDLFDQFFISALIRSISVLFQCPWQRFITASLTQL